MKFLSFACCLLLSVSCKKSTPVIDPGDLSQNLTADINRAGTDFHLSAAGNHTLYLKSVYPNSSNMINDTVITISGSSGTHHLEIRLSNVNAAGVYQFGSYPPRRSIHALYIPNSSGVGYGDYYGNASGVLSGNLNITTLTDNHIAGTFNVACTFSGTVATLTNGSFSGKY